MVNFPIIDSVNVQGYRLYPGPNGVGGLSVSFGPGPWLALGVNGVGKSTLLLILRQLLAGPTWASEAGPGGSNRADFARFDRRIFAERVADKAKDATATLVFRISSATFSVTRHLEDLRLLQFQKDAGEIDLSKEAETTYGQVIAEAVGVGSFADALRIFRYLNFALEDRDSSIWHPTTQSEIFRTVFLTPEKAARFRKLEGQIISADSAARNVNAALFRISQKVEREQKKALSLPAVRAALSALSGKLHAAEEQQVRVFQELNTLEDRRIDARNAERVAAQTSEEKQRTLEQLKFAALGDAIASIPASDQYALIKIVADRVCIVCGNGAEKFAHELEIRAAKRLCLVCGQKHSSTGKVVPSQQLSQSRYERAHASWIEASEVASRARDAVADVDAKYADARQRLAALRAEIDAMAREIRRLERKLPANERSQPREVDEVAALRRRVMEFRAERDEAEKSFRTIVKELRANVEVARDQIMRRFQAHARDFLLEKFRLVYALDTRRVGEMGGQIEFPAFEVELTGGAVDGRTARRTGEQVSLSQREYLDLAFRMAVMEVVGGGATTLVVDGPEVSVDAVFGGRAGEMLANYCSGHGSKRCVIIACNLVITPLIPKFLEEYPEGKQREARVINLLSIGAPTAALEQRAQEYKDAYRRVLRDVGAGGRQ